MLGDPLQEFIEGVEYMYYVTNSREYGENSVRRGGWLFEDSYGCSPWLSICS